MTLREIFSSIGSFFGKLWNGLLDADIFLMLGLVVFFIFPPYIIYGTYKKNRHKSAGWKFGAWIFALTVLFGWLYFLNIYFSA